MARYKDSGFSQSKFIPVVLSQQITPGTFEYTVSNLPKKCLPDSGRSELGFMVLV